MEKRKDMEIMNYYHLREECEYLNGKLDGKNRI